MRCDEEEGCPKESEANAHCPFGLNLRNDPCGDGSMLHLYKKKPTQWLFNQSEVRSTQICVSQYCRKITMLQGERPTRTEPYEVPAYEDGEIKHSMRSSIQHHIVRSQSFLQTDLPLLPVNTQNAEWRVRDEQRQADRQQTSYLSGHPSWTPMI